MPWTPTVRTAARVTSNILQARRVVDMDKKIGLLDPSSTPLLRFQGDAEIKDALIAKKTTVNPKYDWMEDRHLPRADRINLAAGYNAAAVSLVVDNAAYFVPGQTVHVPRTGEYMIVQTVTIATNTLVVLRGIGTVPAAFLLDNEPLRLCGTSSAENADVPALRHTVEVGKFNYTKISRTAWGWSDTEKNSELYGGSDDDYQRALKAIEHGVELEQDLMFGDRSETIDATTNTVNRTSGGLRYWITQNVYDIGGALLTEQDMAAIVRTAFRYNSKDGQRRSKMFVCSRLYISALEFWFKGLLRLDPMSKQYGIEVYDYVSGNGRLKFIPHDLLSEDSYGTWGFILDLPYITVRPMRNRDTKLMLNREGNGIDGEIHEYLTETGLQVKIDDAHAIVMNAGGYT